MAAVICLSFVTCQNPYVGVGFLVLGISFIGCQYGAGFLVNYNDICGRYAGMALGIGNTFASIPGFLVPYLVGVVTKNVCKDFLYFCIFVIFFSK
jgi:ACS family sodium-dependent inorganic phosphate cotransporter